ncbi:antigen WC1.1-like [Bos indicus x Bos taurus]|uniref:antigen WC1.1-like n=1 Tax=Bos indicus x Bos taurus TaxID=30522 RepID=UPI000F7D3345|nr:antigen WC1.1-like [Bos indicus x Bos taurus]
MALGRHLSLQGLCVLLLGTMVGGQALELRLKDGAHRCEGRVEVKHQGEWGTVDDLDWTLKDASVVCRQLGCGAAIGFVRLAGGDAPCSGRVEVYSGEAWIPVSDGNFTLPTAQVICAELGCGKAVSVLGHELFRESSARVWAEEFRSYSEVRLMTNGSSQCEGQVEVKISGQWRALCASHWSLANANVVCRQLGCGVAISTPGGPRLVEGGFVRLAGGDAPCSGRVEVYSGEAWIPVSDGNFTLPTAQVICAELGCGKAVSVLGHELFRESSARVWAEEFRSYSEVRLMTNGSSQCEGQVEVKISGQWRALCASHWSLANANVVCRQLGCGVAISTPGGPRLVEGGDQILTARFHCSGAESFLWSCPVTALGGPDCSHGNTASVICSGNQTQVLPQCNDSMAEPAGSAASVESAPYCSDSRQLRVVGGASPCAGRVEIFDQGSWGTICDDGWDLDDAHVVCRQLGCGEALNATGSAHFGAGSGPIWLDDLNCTGKESHVWRCPSRGWGRHDCRHKQDAGVICSEFLALRMVNEDQQCAGWLEVFYNGTWDSRQLRLVDGGSHCAGRVEILNQGSWGTICDYSWDLDDARVVCRQLGCGKALDATLSSSFGAGSGPIWLDNVRCTGKESHVWRCPSRDWGKHYCDHSQDAGVICSGFLRLAGGDGPCSGRVEVHSGEAWIPVSDGNFTLPTAQVICAELGCGKAVSVLGHVPFRESNARVWAEEFRCEGEEPELRVCPRVPCPGGTCHHSGAVQVVCSVYTDVRLMTNSSSQCEGQVEMNIFGQWRALCASHWSLANANVVCRQLGCGVAISTPNRAEGSDQLWKARFHCSGTESFLWKCPVTTLGVPDCSHGNTASVMCSGNQTQVLPQCDHFVSEPAGSAASEERAPYCSDSRQLRLVDGGSHCAGRVEILDQGSWGTICDDGWDLDDARVVCRQLGCGEALNATGSAHFGAGSGPIWLDDLNCAGNESQVWTCPSPRGWGRHDCRHKEDAGVICSEFLALRMVSEDQQCAGWLEVFYNGTWGSVCRSPMEDITVSVICRQLGCGDSGSLNTSVGLREGSRPQWVDLIQCRKTDTSLWQCPSGPWKYSSCSPKEEAYISCAGRRPKSCPTAAPCTDREKLRLRGGDSKCSGRVEVWHSGSWGTVCDDSWSLAEAEVVCQQLGCGQALEAVQSAAFGPGNGSIWLDEVRCGGRESSLWDCAAEPWGQSDCKHEEDAGVRCSGVRTTVPTTIAGTRTTSNSLPGIFSLPGILCLILGALLFLVLVILMTQLLRWRAERRALSSYEDALAEAVYEELDYLLTQKEGLGSPDQRTDVPAENYDDAEEVPVPGTPSASQGNEEEVPPEKEDGVRSSQTGSYLNFSREAADPGEGEESLWLFQGKNEDAGYDDVELSALGTSPVTFCDAVLTRR